MNYKRLVIFAAIFLVTGCASMERFKRGMDTYIGADLKTLQQQFGYNYIERKLDDGLRAYTWTRIERGTYPGYSYPSTTHTYKTSKGKRVIYTPGYYFPPEYYERICEFSFIVDRNNRAISWRAQGNGCAAYTLAAPVIKSQKQY